MSAIYIDETLAASLINMNDALSLTEEAFKTFAEGKSFNMPRQRMRIRKGALHMLPAAIPYKNVLGYKAYTSFRSGLIFRTHLYDGETGTPLAIVDSNEIGRLRTGAASGVASKYLAKENSETVFIFGGGFQAEAQLEAVCLSVKTIKKVFVSTKTKESATAFAAKMSKQLGITVTPTENVANDLPKSDIIITVTTAAKPLFEHAMLNPKGVHINAAGSNALIRAEIPEKTIESAKYLVVDDKNVAQIECGDILPSLEKGRLHWNEIIELGDVIAGFRKGREENESLSIFESQGMGLQDIICAEFIYKKAIEKNLGKPLPF